MRIVADADPQARPPRDQSPARDATNGPSPPRLIRPDGQSTRVAFFPPPDHPRRAGSPRIPIIGPPACPFEKKSFKIRREMPDGARRLSGLARLEILSLQRLAFFSSGLSDTGIANAIFPHVESGTSRGLTRRSMDGGKARTV